MPGICAPAVPRRVHQKAGTGDHLALGNGITGASVDTVQCVDLVDPRCRHKHRSGEFEGTPYHVPDVAGDRQEIALAAVRRFVEQHGCLPTQDSWPVARMTPYERTVHKMFGSFRAAVEAAGALDLISGRPD